MKRTAGLVDDDAARNRKALPGALADFFGGEEWLEDPAARSLGDADTGICDRDFHRIGIETRTHRNFAEAAGVLDDIRYGMGCIHQQIEDHLIDLAQVARYEWQVAELGVELGDLFVLVMRNHERAADRLIQIGQRFLTLIRMSEFFHRSNDRRNAPEALQ